MVPLVTGAAMRTLDFFNVIGAGSLVGEPSATAVLVCPK
jgi:hypothetical protein